MQYVGFGRGENLEDGLRMDVEKRFWYKRAGKEGLDFFKLVELKLGRTFGREDAYSIASPPTVYLYWTEPKLAAL
jgi:hypothetical protein